MRRLVKTLLQNRVLKPRKRTAEQKTHSGIFCVSRGLSSSFCQTAYSYYCRARDLYEQCLSVKRVVKNLCSTTKKDLLAILHQNRGGIQAKLVVKFAYTEYSYEKPLCITTQKRTGLNNLLVWKEACQI